MDFTPWLAQDDNIALLADAVGLDITIDETESSVGDFNADIFASETGTDRKIIIENQKDVIESDAGLTFDWRELPERKASRIVIEKNVDFGDKNQWNMQLWKYIVP